ncbi:MAG: hypothetical protein FD161_9 [Limisphaerales bacterium]|nr:MAG: hypothetical protein FD161_9 [Limisphaerales bacterium]KAG0510455.1 MAG: hypothetical protein E1N63_9 [Limisphaerales bacterium]TXT52728.1 MAG: hypothetical protein FD140_271 [Limisphaerales bacterium]
METVFVNELRLTGRQWLLVGGIVLAFVLLAPRAWKQAERFDTGPDYRLPYALSKDYWLYERRLGEIPAPSAVVIGDSVVWGEYVLPDGTLSHFLNQAAGRPDAFVNAGVNGLFPLALEGLAEHYGGALRNRKVILHCNLLWMSSPKADLSTKKEERFNHARLVPQFSPRIPCYRADASERLGVVMERNLPVLSWVNHLQCVSFNQKSLPDWTLEQGSGDPPGHPNAYKNPLAQLTLHVPGAPALDPERGPTSARHKPWSTAGEGTTRFEWVALDASLQWAAFQRLTRLLRERGNDVLVVVGPFNEHLLAGENRAPYRQLCDNIAVWLKENRFECIVPEPLPSALYADASHPLTEGYRVLAQRLHTEATFQQWKSRR